MPNAQYSSHPIITGDRGIGHYTGAQFTGTAGFLGFSATSQQFVVIDANGNVVPASNQSYPNPKDNTMQFYRTDTQEKFNHIVQQLLDKGRQWDDGSRDLDKTKWSGHGVGTVIIESEERNQIIYYAEAYIDSSDRGKIQDVVVPPPPPADMEELDKLILADDAKQEIVAVLKQNDKKDLIFTEWGLGETIEYGKGMTYLFYGPPGTGKTWGASCIAKATGKELLVVGAAEIQSSEPGGANRNIQDAFKHAREQNKVLMLDECDSLITTRASVGMVLGSEINTLLTEIERFEGICILTTNRVETLDEALERRISLIVEFPEPDYEQRVQIWEQLIPDKLPLADDVEEEKLAELKLTGGQIKNVLLNAARFAAAEDKEEVSMAYFEMAAARVRKSKNLLGTQSSYQMAKTRYDVGKSGGRKTVGKARVDKVKVDKVKKPKVDKTTKTTKK